MDDLKALVRSAERQGWRVRRTSKNHIAFYAPDGKSIVHAAATPSDSRSTQNAIAQLKKAGFRESA